MIVSPSKNISEQNPDLTRSRSIRHKSNSRQNHLNPSDKKNHTVMVYLDLPNIFVSRIELSLFAHATEDEEKVLTAISNIFPFGFFETVSVNKKILKGEYGNPIIFFKTFIKDQNIAEAMLRKIASNLTILDKEKLLQELELHLKKRTLFLRFDKQNAYRGNLTLNNVDPVHLCIQFKTSDPHEIRILCQKFGLLP